MTDMTTLPDGRTVTWRSDFSASPATLIFRVADADGTILIDQAALTPTGASPTMNIVGIEGLADGGLRVIFHENLFIAGDDGTIYAQDFTAEGLGAAPTIVSEQFHLTPQTRPSIETLSNGTQLYGQDQLHAPDPDLGWGTNIVYPTSFLDQLYPYAQAVTETEAGFAWATMSYGGTNPVLLHLFNDDLSRVAVKIGVGSDRHQPSSDFAATISAVDIDTLEDGRIAVAWITERFADSARAGDAQSGIFVSIFNADGSVSVAETVVSPTDNLNQVFELPRVFALDGGGYAIAFQGRQQGNSALSPALHIQTYDADGVLLNEDTDPRVGSSPLRNLDTPDLVISSNGTSYAMTVDAFVSLDDREVVETDPNAGTNGDDLRTGTDGSEEFNLGSGNDTVNSLMGDDTINAGDGNDLINLQSGNHVVKGGIGFDQIRIEDALSAGLEISFSGSALGDAFTISGLTDPQDPGSARYTVTLTGVELYLNAFTNALNVIGDGGVNAIFLEALPASFTFAGGGGLDELILDMTYAAFNADTQLSGSELELRIFNAARDIGTLLEVEQITFTDGTFLVADLLAEDGGTASALADVLNGGVDADSLSGLEGDDTVAGNAGDDTLFGNQGNDTLLGDDGNDRLDGGQQNDSVVGGAGDDIVFGGSGFDTLRGGAGEDRVIGGDGRDLAFLGAGNDLFIDNAQGGVNGRDTVYANGGDDTVGGGDGDDVFHGNSGADRLLGRLGDDRLFGGDQNDTMVGGDGNDTVAGGNGRDRAYMGDGDDRWFDNDQVQFGDDLVVAGRGNDTIEMNRGDDTATGGEGADAFWFTAGDFGTDVITDYAVGEDQIGLDGALVSSLDQTWLDGISDTSSGDLVLTFNADSVLVLEGLTSNAGLLADLFEL